MGHDLASALVKTGKASLVAAYDSAPGAAAKLATEFGAISVASSVELLGAGTTDAKAPDGVIIALPTDAHESAVVEAADRGVNVYVEKPMSLNTTACSRMLEAAERDGVSLMVGQVMRYYEPYRTILRWTDDGRFGAIRAAAIWRTTKGMQPGANNWRYDQNRSGGVLFEVGIHELDILRCLFGEPLTVRSEVREFPRSNGSADEFLSIQVKFRDGVANFETGGVNQIGRYGFRMHFDKATVESDSVFDTSRLHVYRADGEVSLDLQSELSTHNPVQAELSEWIDALRGERPVPITGREGLASVAFAQAVRRSADSGGIVVDCE